MRARNLCHNDFSYKEGGASYQNGNEYGDDNISDDPSHQASQMNDDSPVRTFAGGPALADAHHRAHASEGGPTEATFGIADSQRVITLAYLGFPLGKRVK
jgi:hypothetical protein